LRPQRADVYLAVKNQSILRKSLLDCVALCESLRDYVSRELLEDVLEDAEEHIDWLEVQLGLIDKTGLKNYLQSQI
jgi:bacterioferritin